MRSSALTIICVYRAYICIKILKLNIAGVYKKWQRWALIVIMEKLANYRCNVEMQEKLHILPQTTIPAAEKLYRLLFAAFLLFITGCKKMRKINKNDA